MYAPQNIYLQKIMAIAGTRPTTDELGRETASGRWESRDVLDMYYLSNEVTPLHKFLASVPPQQQRGMVQWYRSYSRQQFKLDLLDLNLYDQNLDASAVIAYLDSEVNQFVKETLN